MQLTQLSDDELLTQLTALCTDSHRLTGRLLLHLIEVDERRLDAKSAYSSLYDFCVRRLGMSEGAAYRKINAARLVKRFPQLLGPIERGDVHLSALVTLRAHLDESNVDELIAAATGKTQRQVEELMARRAPKPDVPSSMTPLPDASASSGRHEAGSPFEASSSSSPFASLPSEWPASSAGQGSFEGLARSEPLGLVSAARIEPLSGSRFRVQLTASQALRDKLERAVDLMRHRNPSGDLAVVVERAVDLLLAKLEKERLGKATRSSKDEALVASAPPADGSIPRATRREVFERDGESCSYVDASGRRCSSTAWLELDHIEPRAQGGLGCAANVRVLCRTHNRLHAEESFGKSHVAQQIDLRQRRSASETAGEAMDLRQRRSASEKVTPDRSDLRQRRSDRVTSGKRGRGAGPAATPSASVRDVAVRGLVGLGFGRSDAQNAVNRIALRPLAKPLRLEEVLRQALATLT